jgi:aminoglycoside phosphotransferase (APT) family kinase protein
MIREADEPARLASALTQVMNRAGVRGEVLRPQRLSGGANMQSWLFDCGDDRFVLRRAPSDDWIAARPLDLAGEAAVIRHARAGGVPAPVVIAELQPSDKIGQGFIMRAIAGTAEPGVVLSGDPAAMIGDLAGALARIHAIDPAPLGFLPALVAADGVEGLAAQFAGLGGDRPIIALGLAWLRCNLPPARAARLVHGDFRVGNVMADHGRLTGVLDWELAHTGDFHEDLAFGCMAVWRFGKLDRPAFGFADLDTFFAAYNAAGGEPVDREAFRFWLVYRTVWWALGCLSMGVAWRSGTDRSLERVVVARRAAEQELDLLALLEGDAPEAERNRALPAAPAEPPPPHGEPDASEILTAVSEWLASTIKPKLAASLEGRDRFDLAVAQNALGIVRRELATRPDPHDKALSDALLARQTGLATPGLLARLRRAALDTCTADMPKYPSLTPNRAAWDNNREEC